MPRAASSSCAAPPTSTPAPAARTPAGRSRAPSTGSAPRSAVDAEVRLYDRLFTVPEPGADGDFKQFINPHSLEVVTAKLEPSLQNAAGPTNATNSSGSAISPSTRIGRSKPGRPRLQPHHHAEGHLGEAGRAEITAESGPHCPRPTPASTSSNHRNDTHRIGIIGGTGLYHLEGFAGQKWVA